jgi:hypothetical protein
MATYPSIFSQVETAFKSAFESIASTDLDAGWTVYKGSDYNQEATPAIVIHAASFDPTEEATGFACASNFAVLVEVSAITEGEDSTGTVHGNVAGLVQAVLYRSALHIKDAVNTVGTTDFTAMGWTPGPARNDFQSQRITTTFTGRLYCASTDPA